MRFIDPNAFFWLIPLLPAVALLIVRAGRRRRSELERLLGRGEDRKAAVRLSPTARRFRIALLVSAMVLLVAAAARPYWSSQLLPTAERGRDVAVVFDVSKSMLAKDLPPSRLDHAKFILRQLAKRCAGDRLALVAFAGNAYTACPLTADPVAFDEYVNELSPDLVPVGGTDLEAALREAKRIFRSADGDRAIVLLTDGDELSGNSAKMIAGLRSSRIPLFVIGLGDPEQATPLPDETGALRRDAKGGFITSRLNEAALQKLAAETGGVYVRSSVTAPGTEIVADRIAALGAAAHGERRRMMPEEKFPFFVFLAAGCLLLALLISERPRIRRAAGVLFAVLFAVESAAAPPPVRPPAEAEVAADTPLKRETAPTAAKKSAPELYNAARASQEAGDMNAARSGYEEVIGAVPPQERLRSKAFFNLGADEHRRGRDGTAAANAAVREQKLDEAQKRLAETSERLAAAREFYTRALGGPGAEAVEAESAVNLELLAADLREAETLRKRIEELEKRKEQARQSAKNARQQNRQQQEQQDKRNQQQAQRNRNQPRDQRQSSVREAQKQSENLREQAEKLGQQKLAEQARRAAEELKRAEREQQRNRNAAAQRHLDNAVRELGADKDGGKPPKREGETPGGGDGRERENKEKKPEQSPPPPRPGNATDASGNGGPDDKSGARQLLRLLNDEEKGRREELMRGRRMRRPAVDKDW